MPEPLSPVRWIAFEGHTLVHHGAPEAVAESVHALLKARPEALPVVFDDRDSQRVELIWQLPMDKVQNQVTVYLKAAADAALLSSPADRDKAPGAAPADAPRGRGRPKLGVTAREVTLLPTHWAWLSAQPGGASVMLRKLVHAAMRADAGIDSRRKRIDAAYRFMSITGSDQAHFENASRALFAGDLPEFLERISGWPADIRAHLTHLAIRALGDTPA